MGPSEKVVWKIYVGVLGAVTTIAAQRIVKAGWKAATGDDPPAPSDPSIPFRWAATWALASGIGIGLTQMLTRRMAARHWSKAMGHQAPGIPDIKVKI